MEGMGKIKKCPYCAQKEIDGYLKVRKYFIKFSLDSEYSAVQYAVFCSSCKCIGPYSVLLNDKYTEKTEEEKINIAKKQAILYWNARVGRR